jgi:hypothetical protein
MIVFESSGMTGSFFNAPITIKHTVALAPDVIRN